jgi:alanyl-tRNA synthetase
MTERLYYTDPNLTQFEGRFVGFAHPTQNHPHLGIILDRTAFYPTSGGQIFDTGFLSAAEESIAHDLRIIEVTELPNGDVVHCIEFPEGGIGIQQGALLRGVIDRPRRRDHMQQHTGQHLLSAVFIELLNAPTVSFHMGDETCTIDLDVRALSADQIRNVELRANQIITDDVPVEIRFATSEEARQMGVRKIPPDLSDKLRLIEIRGHDLTACGGTHVGRTGEIGSILIRKMEKVKQGMRVEFVCGGRAVVAARRDFDTLTSAAAMFSSHIHDLPEQIRKSLDEVKAAGKREQRTQAELAEFMAARIVAETPEANGIRLIRRTFADRDMAFIKLLAQKLAANPNVVALLASTATETSLVFAQSAGGRFDMGALMKDAMSRLGGRGGGTRDMAQGGAALGADIENGFNLVATKIASAL